MMAAKKTIFSSPLAPISSSAAFLSVMSDSSCLLISPVTRESHDQGMRELSRVTRLPVPVLTGEELMGVFSLLVLQSSAFIRMGTGYLDDLPNLQNPAGIKLPA